MNDRACACVALDATDCIHTRTHPPQIDDCMDFPCQLCEDLAECCECPCHDEDEAEDGWDEWPQPQPHTIGSR